MARTMARLRIIRNFVIVTSERIGDLFVPPFLPIFKVGTNQLTIKTLKVLYPFLVFITSDGM
ncbi:hypothetical protein GCM10028804_29970 [Larkinella terrae]